MVKTRTRGGGEVRLKQGKGERSTLNIQTRFIPLNEERFLYFQVPVIIVSTNDFEIISANSGVTLEHVVPYGG